MIIVNLYSVNGVPVKTVPEQQAPTVGLFEKIEESRLENKCEVDQDRKDLCERCIRYLFELNTGYLGCCTNYDGIYDFCENFLNYSFGENNSPKAKPIGSYRKD